MKVLIYSGVFNPVHQGHLKILQDAIMTISPDKIIVVVVKQMMSMGTGVMPPNPLMLGTGAPPHLRTTFALPHPTFHMLGFPPPPSVAPFVPLNIAPSLPLVPPSISRSSSSPRNSNPTHHKRDRCTKYS